MLYVVETRKEDGPWEAGEYDSYTIRDEARRVARDYKKEATYNHYSYDYRVVKYIPESK